MSFNSVNVLIFSAHRDSIGQKTVKMLKHFDFIVHVGLNRNNKIIKYKQPLKSASNFELYKTRGQESNSCSVCSRSFSVPLYKVKWKSNETWFKFVSLQGHFLVQLCTTSKTFPGGSSLLPTCTCAFVVFRKKGVWPGWRMVSKKTPSVQTWTITQVHMSGCYPGGWLLCKCENRGEHKQIFQRAIQTYQGYVVVHCFTRCWPWRRDWFKLVKMHAFHQLDSQTFCEWVSEWVLFQWAICHLPSSGCCNQSVHQSSFVLCFTIYRRVESIVLQICKIYLIWVKYFSFTNSWNLFCLFSCFKCQIWTSLSIK